MTRAGPAVEENSLVVGLWVHETLRVFYDRLINDEDRTWLTGLLSSMLPCQDFSLTVVTQHCCTATMLRTMCMLLAPALFVIAINL